VVRVLKRYGSRKLYDTEASRYATLDELVGWIRDGQQVRVVDNESGEDITSITLSQILVDTERSNRAVPGNLLSGLFQRGGDALYDALSRGVDDASERLEDFQRTMRKLLRVRSEGGDNAALDGEEGGERTRDWIAFSPPDLDQLVQRTLERVLKMLDLPTRSDIDALNARIDRLTEALGQRVPPRPAAPPAPPVQTAHAESDPD
jgi:polyhydroxyalkanoate synthesis repressor PhaR